MKTFEWKKYLAVILVLCLTVITVACGGESDTFGDADEETEAVESVASGTGNNGGTESNPSGGTESNPVGGTGSNPTGSTPSGSKPTGGSTESDPIGGGSSEGGTERDPIGGGNTESDP